MPKAKKPSNKSPAASNQKVASAAPRIVNQSKAAAHCGTSVNNLRYHIDRYDDFPVEDKTGGHQGWKIDLDKLDAWRVRTGLLLPGKKDDDAAASPNTQRAQAQADLIRMQVEEKRGTLISKEFAVRCISTTIAAASKKMDLMPMKVGKKVGLSAEGIRYFTKLMDEARAEMVASIQRQGLGSK